MAYVIWLTGVSGAGKSTLAEALVAFLKERGIPVESLDGDVVRDFFENDLGYSRPERILNVRRIAFAAKMLAEHGTNVVVANIAPYYEVRDFIRRKLPHYIQIYVKASRDEVIRRDVKGHYAKAASGEMKDMVGIDDGYDVPRQPDLTLETDQESEQESLQKILSLLERKGVLK